MKTSIICAAAIVGLLAATATAQPTPAPKTSGSNPAVRMPTYHVRADIPTAIHIVEPRLQKDYAGLQVEMKFTVDKEGKAYNIGTHQNVDPNLVVQLTAMLREWKFDPARDEANNAIERTVILPVIIDEPVGTTPKAASGVATPAPAPVQARATTRKDPVVTMNAYHVRADIPTAVDVIVPRISTNYSGKTVELKFIVDTTGHPYNVSATDMSVDPSLVTQLWSAVGAWRFDPARDPAGTAIERTIILPLVVD